MVLNYSKAEAGKLGAEKSKITCARKLQERIDSYSQNPLKCRHCQSNLSYQDRHKIFCNRKCSATFNNLKRGKRTTPTSWTCGNCGKEHPVYGWKVGKYCSIECQANYQTKERIKQWVEEGKDWGKQVPRWAKLYLAEQKGYSCQVCGVMEWNGKKLSLECDHIDGDHKNNHPSNLRLICPNCHSQTDTYKARNKGNGRSYRRK